MKRREAIDTAGNIEAQILAHLKTGPVMAFGSHQEVGRILQELKARGAIKYTKAKDGGNGWELR